MKKLFISQPMKDKTNDEIERERERAIAKRLNISVSLSKSSTPFLRMHRTTQSHFGFWLSLSGLWQMRISFISPRVGRTHAAA